MSRLFILSAVAIFTFGCASSAVPPTEEALNSLKASDRGLQQAIADRDLNKIMAFYSDDAILHPTAKPAINGKPFIETEWKSILGIPDFSSTSTMTKAEVAAGGDIAYTMGTYLARMKGENGKPTTEPGKYLSIWKKYPDGSWRIVVETYNTDIPPPDHK